MVYERKPSRREDQRFYASMAWMNLRRSFLSSFPLCQDCDARGLVVPARHVHHKVDRKADPSRALDWDNLEALCVSCHGAKRNARNA